MKVCIVGWYGTETLGDRSILDGIITVLSCIDSNIEIFLSSLYPVLSERTIYEDFSLFNSHGSNVSISVFDAYSSKELHHNIKKSHVVMMGGGPLMDIDELFIIQHAFKFAKRNKKKTILMGCGFGPLNRKEYLKSTKIIVKNSDLIIMRSQSCAKKIIELCGNSISSKVYSSADPAMISVMDYFEKNKYKNNKNGNWVINIRDLDYVYNTKYLTMKITSIVESLSKQVDLLELIPMHTFSVGGDDRYIQNRIARLLSYDRIIVNQKPLTLKQMYDKVMTAKGCIGMRYHSIVFQMFLNGNNYILDYTDKKTGKIKSFLDSYDFENFYSNRYLNILEDDVKLFSLTENKNFVWKTDILESLKNDYIKYLKKVI